MNYLDYFRRIIEKYGATMKKAVPLQNNNPGSDTDIKEFAFDSLAGFENVLTSVPDFIMSDNLSPKAYRTRQSRALNVAIRPK